MSWSSKDRRTQRPPAVQLLHHHAASWGLLGRKLGGAKICAQQQRTHFTPPTPGTAPQCTSCRMSELISKKDPRCTQPRPVGEHVFLYSLPDQMTREPLCGAPRPTRSCHQQPSPPEPSLSPPLLQLLLVQAADCPS